MVGTDLMKTFQSMTKRIASSRGGPALRVPEAKEPSSFVREAAVIQRALGHLDKRLEKLMSLAKKESIFDDATVEIGELTAVLKQDRDRVEKMLEMITAKVDTSQFFFFFLLLFPFLP